MKKLMKVLATLMLMMGFCFNTFAVVDCNGLSDIKKATYKARSFSELGKEIESKSSEYSRCMKFNRNYPNVSWDYVDKFTRIKRIQDEQWDGVVRYASDIQASKKVESKAVVKKKSDGQFLSETGGFYKVVEKYGLEDGLTIIENFWHSRGYPEDGFHDIKNHLKKISPGEIKNGADNFSLNSKVKKFLDDIR